MVAHNTTIAVNEANIGHLVDNNVILFCNTAKDLNVFESIMMKWIDENIDGKYMKTLAYNIIGNSMGSESSTSRTLIRALDQ